MYPFSSRTHTHSITQGWRGAASQHRLQATGQSALGNMHSTCAACPRVHTLAMSRKRAAADRVPPVDSIVLYPPQAGGGGRGYAMVGGYMAVEVGAPALPTPRLAQVVQHVEQWRLLRVLVMEESLREALAAAAVESGFQGTVKVCCTPPSSNE